MKKELKKQIKEDEFLSGVDVAWKWLKTHEKIARNGLIAVVVVVILGGGLRYLQGKREQDAAAAFDAAMRIYDAPVTSETQGAPPAGVVPFKEAREKFTKAAAAFDGVERSYPSHAVGRRARYFAALSRMELGEYEPARQALQSLAGGAAGFETSMAKLSLADLERRAGAVDKAVGAYRALADDAGLAIPRDYVLMALAATLEDARRTQEAVASYQSVYERFPDSVYAAEAQRRAAYLRAAPQG